MNTVFEEGCFILFGGDLGIIHQFPSITDRGLLLDFWMTVDSWAGGSGGQSTLSGKEPQGLLGCRDVVWAVAGFPSRVAQEAAAGKVSHI